MEILFGARAVVSANGVAVPQADRLAIWSLLAAFTSC